MRTAHRWRWTEYMKRSFGNVAYQHRNFYENSSLVIEVFLGLSYGVCGDEKMKSVSTEKQLLNNPVIERGSPRSFLPPQNSQSI